MQFLDSHAKSTTLKSTQLDELTMALKHAESGEVVNIYSAYSQILESRSLAIVSATEIEVHPPRPERHLAASVMHGMRAVADSPVLLTLFRPH